MSREEKLPLLTQTSYSDAVYDQLKDEQKEQEKRTEVKDIPTDILSNGQALKMVIKDSGNFAAARLFYALNTIGIGITMGQLGKDQIAAGSIFTSLQYLLVGFPQGIMMASSYFFSINNGAKKFSEIGKVSRAAWKVGGIASILTIAGLLASPFIIGAAHGMNSNVQKYVEEYVDYFSIAVLPILLSITDQQIAVAIKDRLVPLGFILIYSGLATGLGIPMVLGYLGNAVSGVKGYGISTGISAWMGFIVARAYYYLNSKYQPYDLFQLTYTSDINYSKEIRSLGWKFGLQVSAEFANLFATSLLLSSYGHYSDASALQMAVPVIQIGSAWGLVAIGLGQGQGNVIANERGVMKKAKEESNGSRAIIGKANITKLANQGLVLGTSLSCVVAIICAVRPNWVTYIFLSDSLEDHEVDTAQELLQISSLGIIFDTLRNLFAGNLKGFKDLNYATHASFWSMTGLFIVAGIPVLWVNDSLTQLIWLRNLTIGISMIATGLRWRKFNNLTVEEQIAAGQPPPPTNNVINSLASTSNQSMWSRLNCFKKRREEENLDRQDTFERKSYCAIL